MMSKYFNEALKASELSIDPNTKVGCVIVKDDVIISRGYNTLPKGLKCEEYPLDCREGAFLDTKYPYMIHSEAKAIIDAGCHIDGASLYVTLFPCNECAKLIIESGIKELFYIDDFYANHDNVKASKRMLNDCGIVFQQVKLDTL